MEIAVFQWSFIYKDKWQAGFLPACHSLPTPDNENAMSTRKSWNQYKPQKNVIENYQNMGYSGVLK